MRVTQMNSLSQKSGTAPRPQTVSPPAAFSENRNSSYNIKEMLKRFEKDDYILLGIIAVLIFEGCDDYILLAALGYLFFMGLK